MKRIITILLAIAFAMVVSPMPVFADDAGDLIACEQLLDECSGAECDCQEPVECAESTWKALILDRKIQTAVITVVIAIVGAVVGAQVVP